MRLGTKAVKAVTLSLWTQALVTATQGKSKLDANRFCDHSIFVGYLARYLFSCRFHKGNIHTGWSPDEVFAAGILHDLGTALFAVVDGPAFDRVHNLARSRNVSFAEQFKKIYEHEHYELGVTAVKTWGLDPLFAEIIAFLETPEEHPTEAIAISCVHLADRIATANKHALFDLPSAGISEFAEAEIGIAQEDMKTVVDLIAASMQEHEPNKRRRPA